MNLSGTSDAAQLKPSLKASAGQGDQFDDTQRLTPYTDLLKQKDQALMRAGIPIGGFMDGGVINEQVLRVNN